MYKGLREALYIKDSEKFYILKIPRSYIYKELREALDIKDSEKLCI